MAKRSAAWGIDIGQCALKALRITPGDEPGQVVADAFDYIEYPKILSQPEAEPEELVREALGTFLSRNTVRGVRVGVSAAGQSGLARFIKLPPVESKKIPDIVKYEARQQIPFALEDVVWDYQQMAGGAEEEGFSLETEVGLFAMKRDQVARALKPFDDAGIEVDVVQLTPLALYNFAAFDQLRDLPPLEEYDPDDPPESLVLISLGTDTTDLVVTNGYKVWQRSIPLGGSHFTKALTKELKFTFAKAEHLKRNARQAEDPKAVFQAMRPVFNDLLTEVQRSIGYFKSIERTAKIGKILAMGNAMKLPGLQRYLTQHLGIEVNRLAAFGAMSGPGVVDAPMFKDNVLSFGTSYGLALQALGDTKIRTNLLPPEIRTDRLIREKKPWAVGMAAAILMGLTASLFGHYRAWNSVRDELFNAPVSTANSVAQQSDELRSKFTEAKSKFTTTSAIGQHLVHNVEGRILWLEVLKAINAALPQDPEVEVPDDQAGERNVADELAERNKLYINYVKSAEVSNIESWFAAVKQWYVPPADESAEPTDGGNAPPNRQNAGGGQQAGRAGAPKPPSGAGWIFEIQGYHYHNKDLNNQGAEYVRNTLIKNLHQATLTVDGVEIPVADLGIAVPVLTDPGGIDRTYQVADPRAVAGAPGEAQTMIPLPRFDFTVQFAWKVTPPSQRKPKQQPGANEAPVNQAAGG